MLKYPKVGVQKMTTLKEKFLPFLHDYLEEIEMKASFSQNHLKQVGKIDFLQFKSIETCLKFLIS